MKYGTLEPNGIPEHRNSPDYSEHRVSYWGNKVILSILAGLFLGEGGFI